MPLVNESSVSIGWILPYMCLGKRGELIATTNYCIQRAIYVELTNVRTNTEGRIAKNGPERYGRQEQVVILFEFSRSNKKN